MKHKTQKINDINNFTPFVVFGSSKSGTTWIQKMLDAHPDISCHFQTPIFPFDIQKYSLFLKHAIVFSLNKSPFGGVFETKDAETEYYLQEQFIKKSNILYSDFIYKNFSRKQILKNKVFLKNLQCNIIRQIVYQLLKDKNKSIWGTKAYTNLELLFDVFPQAKLIHVIRDGRDVCISKRFHMLRRQIFYQGDEKYYLHKLLNRWYLTNRMIRFLQKTLGVFGIEYYKNADELKNNLLSKITLTKFATDWKLIVEYILSYQEKYPNNVIMVKYENLQNGTFNEIQKVLKFLNATTDTKIISAIMDRTNFNKFKKGKGDNFFRKGMSGDWKNYFSTYDIKLFKIVAGELLMKLGYEKSHDWDNKNA